MFKTIERYIIHKGLFELSEIYKSIKLQNFLIKKNKRKTERRYTYFKIKFVYSKNDRNRTNM